MSNVENTINTVVITASETATDIADTITEGAVESATILATSVEETAPDVATSFATVADKIADAGIVGASSLADVAKEAMSMGVSGGSALFEYLQAEVPELLTQFLLWKGCEAGVKMIIYFTPLFLTIWALKRIIGLKGWVEKKEEKMSSCEEGLPTIAWGASGIAVLSVGSVWFANTAQTAINSALDLLKITVAPKIYILEYLAGLL